MSKFYTFEGNEDYANLWKLWFFQRGATILSRGEIIVLIPAIGQRNGFHQFRKSFCAVLHTAQKLFLRQLLEEIKNFFQKLRILKSYLAMQSEKDSSKLFLKILLGIVVVINFGKFFELLESFLDYAKHCSKSLPRNTIHGNLRTFLKLVNLEKFKAIQTAKYSSKLFRKIRLGEIIFIHFEKVF